MGPGWKTTPSSLPSPRLLGPCSPERVTSLAVGLQHDSKAKSEGTLNQRLRGHTTEDRPQPDTPPKRTPKKNHVISIGLSYNSTYFGGEKNTAQQKNPLIFGHSIGFFSTYLKLGWGPTLCTPPPWKFQVKWTYGPGPGT